MQLRFLGKPYTVHNFGVETVPSDITARFRGQSYHLRRPIQTSRSQLSQLDFRIYRGIAYCKNS